MSILKKVGRKERRGNKILDGLTGRIKAMIDDKVYEEVLNGKKITLPGKVWKSVAEGWKKPKSTNTDGGEQQDRVD
jgi:hypothetical protein